MYLAPTCSLMWCKMSFILLFEDEFIFFITPNVVHAFRLFLFLILIMTFLLRRFVVRRFFLQDKLGPTDPQKPLAFKNMYVSPSPCSPGAAHTPQLFTRFTRLIFHVQGRQETSTFLSSLLALSQPFFFSSTALFFPVLQPGHGEHDLLHHGVLHDQSFAWVSCPFAVENHPGHCELGSDRLDQYPIQTGENTGHR